MEQVILESMLLSKDIAPEKPHWPALAALGASGLTAASAVRQQDGADYPGVDHQRRGLPGSGTGVSGMTICCAPDAG
jgi:hypothetical protein